MKGHIWEGSIRWKLVRVFQQQWHELAAGPELWGGVQRRGAPGVELCTDGLRHALIDEAEQFGSDVVAGELE
jgi:hypothetical protein